MRSHWLPILGLAAAAAACGSDKEETAADQAQDTAAVVTAANRGPSANGATVRPVSARDSSAGTALVVQVQEETPGLLAQARYNPLDAQHIAQGKYPTGKVEAGFIERRGDDLVYRFRIKLDEGVRNDVLVNSFDGKIINSIPVPR